MVLLYNTLSLIFVNRVCCHLFDTVYFDYKNCITLKEFSLHSEIKKLSVIKMHSLELASYVLSVIETLQNTRGQRERSWNCKRAPLMGGS